MQASSRRLVAPLSLAALFAGSVALCACLSVTPVPILKMGCDAGDANACADGGDTTDGGDDSSSDGSDTTDGGDDGSADGGADGSRDATMGAGDGSSSG